LSIARRKFSVAAMASRSNPRIAVELDAGADPIRGEIEYADGRRRPFWGWLELSAELRRLAAGESEDATRQQHRPKTEEV
jgi:hypothetical protein